MTVSLEARFRPAPGSSWAASSAGGSAGGSFRVGVGPALDAEEGCELLAVAGKAIFGGADKLCVDLRPVTSFTEQGVAAAAECRRLAASLPHGVNFLVGTATSRAALLAIFARP